MQIVEIGPQLNKILTTHSDWFFSQDDYLELPDSPCEIKEHTHTIQSACGEEYLAEVQAKGRKHRGVPEISRATSFQHDMWVPKNYKEESKRVNKELIDFLGAKFSAVHVFYKPDCFMSWHCNWDCPGYNVLLSYNKTGNGFFRYQDPVTKEIVNMEDTPGWSCKVGYFGGHDEEDKIFWHTAGSYEPRITFGFVVPHKGMWEMMIEDIAD